jgi:hypothetical protein
MKHLTGLTFLDGNIDCYNPSKKTLGVPNPYLIIEKKNNSLTTVDDL